MDVPGDLPLLDQVEQVGADVLGPELFGRGVEVLGEIGDPLDVASDRLGGQVVEDQVLGHATAQRRHGQLPSRWCARTGSPSAASMIGERSRAWSGAVRTGTPSGGRRGESGRGLRPRRGVTEGPRA